MTLSRPTTAMHSEARPLIDKRTRPEIRRRRTQASPAKMRAMVLILALVSALLAGIVLSSSDSQAYTTYSPILIQSDSDFSTDPGVVNGTGAELDPYIITGWDIQAGSANGIDIRDTNAYYVIHNVSVWHDTYNYNNYYGIYLENAPNGRVENATVSGYVKAGIYVVSASNIAIHDNSISVESSLGKDRYGIDIHACPEDVQVTSNTVSDANYGIRLYASTGTVVTGNDVSDTPLSSIVSMASRTLTISDNVMTLGGVLIWGYTLADYNSHTVTDDNLINGKEVFYACNSSGLTVDDAGIGQVILANCTDTEISDMDFTDVATGIGVAYCNDTRIDGCDMSGMGWYAVYAFASDNLTVSNSMMHDGEWGVYAYTGAHLTISDTAITSNTNKAVYAYLVSKLNITGCDISENENGGLASGIVYQASSPATDMESYITYNVIRGNDLGLSLVNVGGVHVDHNDFVDNLEHARDTAGSENYWDDGSEGNYWDNYTGVDIEDPIGIGEDPFIIDGNTWDNYPLMDYQAIPEFGDIVVPVVAVLLIFGVILRRNTRTGRRDR